MRHAEPDFDRVLRDLVAEDRRRGRDPLLERLRREPLDPPALRRWAAQYYLVVREFSRLLSAIHSRCPDLQARRLIAENLYEEHGHFVEDQDHPALMRRFGRAVGLTDAEMEATPPLPETAEYLATLFRLTQGRSYLEGLAAVGLGVEAPVPRYFARLEPLLREQHGLDADATRFFREHIGEDEEHAERARAVIVRGAVTSEQQAAVVEALREAQAARARFRDGVFRAVGAG